MNRKHLKIYDILKDKKLHTSKKISEKIGMSEKTTRKMISELKKELEAHKIKLNSKVGKGYLIECDKDVELIGIENDVIPNGVEERIDYLIDMVFFKKNPYIKIDDVSYKIYVSDKTVSNDIKKIKKNIEKYGIKFKNRPHYGFYVEGKEVDIRRFLNKYVEKNLSKNLFKTNINKLYEFTKKFCFLEKIDFSDISFFYLVIAIYVAVERVKIGKTIKNAAELENIKNVSYEEKVSKYLASLREKLDINLHFSDLEIKYITMYFLTNEKSVNNKNHEIHDLLEKIYKFVYLTFKIELSKDIYENLYNHIVALTIRMRFGIEIQNFLLEEIKKNMQFEYTVSEYITKIIADKYGVNISDDEIGYISVIIHLGIHKNEIEKKKVLLVCPAGRATSLYLKKMYENLFSSCIDKIDICALKDLDYMDLSKYDCVFSIVDINKKYLVPIYKVNAFLNNEDISFVKNKLTNKEQNNNIGNIIDEDLFINIKENLSKNQIIEKLCDLIIKKTNTKIDLYKKVLEREELGFTEFENQVALPHPIESNFSFSKIAVAVLDKPILWDKKYIQIIILTCIKDEDVDSYCESIINLMGNENKIKDLINNPCCEKFLKLCESKGEKND